MKMKRRNQAIAIIILWTFFGFLVGVYLSPAATTPANSLVVISVFTIVAFGSAVLIVGGIDSVREETKGFFKQRYNIDVDEEKEHA